MKNTTETSALSLLANDAGYDPLEDRLRENIRSTIEAVFEEELAQFLGRCRYGREDALRQGYPIGSHPSTAGGNRVPSKLRRHLRSRSSRDGDAPHKLCWRSRSCPSSPFPPAEPTPEPTYALGYAAIDVSVVAGPLPEASRHSGKREKAAALLADLDALRDLPAVPLEACEHVPGQVSSTALVRYRLVDYSAPAIHAHKRVMVKGYVDRVEIALGAETVARHRRSYVRE